MTRVARHARAALEIIHSMIYFAPEAETRFTALGLESSDKSGQPSRMTYYAGRAAPMGAVSAGVVTATFYNFNPESVARHIPRAWTLATPEAIIEARFEAADAALRRLLGDEVVASPELAEVADLARAATAGCTPDGRPLYAGHADLDWPDEPHLRLWHAVSLLREFRGDGHIIALQQAGLSGLQALVLHSTVRGGFLPTSAKTLREWSDEQWDAAATQVRERGLIDADGEITEAGRALREQTEEQTDALAMAPWALLGEDRTRDLIERGGKISKALAAADALPSGMFKA